MNELKFELDKINLKIKNKVNFSLIRFGDLELKVMNNIDITHSGGRWSFNSKNKIEQKFRNDLIKSFQFKSNNFYTGIICPECYNTVSILQSLKKFRNETKNKNLTFAKIWSDNNYHKFLNETLPLFKNYNVYLICHHKAKVDKLPFSIKKIFKINTNPWIRNTDLLKNIKKTIETDNIRNQLFLFCAGPYSNILIQKLYNYNPNNLYIDLGSPLDPYFYGKNTRKYLIYPKRYNDQNSCKWTPTINNY